MLRVCKGWQSTLQMSRTLLFANLHTSSPAPVLQLKMPSLSPTMAEGTIVKWLKVNIRPKIQLKVQWWIDRFSK